MASCADCGYFGVITRKERQLASAEKRLRESWDRPVHGNMHVYDDSPICACHGLPGSESQMLKGEPSRETVLSIIHLERNCARFTPWLPGIPIEEYHRMYSESQLLKIQEDSRERDRKWQAEQRAKDQERQEQRERQTKQERADEKESDRKWQAKQKLRDRMWGLAVGAVLAILGWWLRGKVSGQ